MNDYGFATYDEKTGKKRQGTVNSKWPIFGPKYSQIGNCFKTIHITDTTIPEFKDADLPEPQVSSGQYDFNEYRWHEKELVHQFKHGFKYRPVGYAVFSGDLHINVDCTITQTVTMTGNPDPMGGDFTISGRAMQNMPVLPNIKSQMVPSYISTAYSPSELSIGNYFFGIKGDDNSGPATRSDIIVPSSCYYYVKQNYIVANRIIGNADVPYVVEIDDEYVKIYRNNYWLDFRGRFYQSYTSTLTPSSNYTRNIDFRVKGATDYAGSSLDCTIYLAPYKLEDLI